MAGKRESNWKKPYFFDEAAAFAHVESILWPDGPICPKCGSIDNATKLMLAPTKRPKKVKGKIIKGDDGKPVMVEQPARQGVWKCKAKECRAQFTVRMGTLFEESRMPMTKWLQAIYLMAASKKGISAHQLKRVLECDQKSAWFLAHRVREAMRDGDLSPFGAGGGPVEVDETFIGRNPHRKLATGYEHKMKVLSLVDRSTGKARSMVVDKLTIKDLTPILKANIAQEARVMTDQAGYYHYLSDHFAKHDVLNHAKDEYARTEEGVSVTTNNIEGFFSVFKRGMKGVYQHCAPKHLHRYLAEFDFRYSNRVALGVDDQARATKALQGFVGKRLSYRGSDGAVA